MNYQSHLDSGTPMTNVALATDRSVLLKISPRLMTFWEHVCTNATFEEIAVMMKTTPKAIEGYRSKLCMILDIKTKTDLSFAALHYGLLTLNAEGERVWQYMP